MSAKVADIFDSNETTETSIPKRGRKSGSKGLNTSGRSRNDKRCNQVETRRSSRNQNRNLKDETSPKVLKLFPIFICRNTNENSKNNIEVGESNGAVYTDDNQPDFEIRPINYVDNSAKKSPDKTVKKRPISRKYTRKKTFREIAIDCDDKKLIKLDITTDSQPNLLQSENAGTIILPDPTNTESEVLEIVNYICQRTEKAIDYDDATALTHNDLRSSDTLTSSTENNLKFNGRDKVSGFNKQKRKRQIKSSESESVKISDSTENMPEISTRRKSLRSRGNRNKLINYSEIAISYTQEQKRKPKKSLTEYSDNHGDECMILNSGANEYSKNVPTDTCRINSSKGRKGKNVKEKVKLFPIFTSNKVVSNAPFRNCSTSIKRKVSVEEIPVESDDEDAKSENKNLYSAKRLRKKRIINKCGDLKQVSSVEHDNLLCDSQKNLDKKYKSSVIKSKTLENSDSSENTQEGKNLKPRNKCFENTVNRELDKSFISYSEDIYSTDDEVINKSNELESTSLKVTSYKKVNNLYFENISFPVLSHVNAGSESSDTVSKFLINDEVPVSDVVLPVWNEVVGLTDVHSIREIMRKSHFNVKNKITNSTCVSSDKIRNENDENMLWTDSLQNTVTEEKNNEVAINEIKSWLLEWKNKFCRVTEQKENDSDSESFSSDSDSDDDSLSNSIIISGTSGSGKTSLVFSLASELGFTVIEVNASSSRNGRNISHQLKEALESYHVESIKIEKSIEDSITDTKRETGHEFELKNTRISQNKDIKSFFERKHQMRASSGEKKKSIAAFFQAGNSEEKCANSKPKTRNKRLDKSQPKKDICKKSSSATEKANGSLKYDKKSCKISSLTIILFEDVDIVFEEDEGFWSTVKGFLKISKKPVIFTVSRNLSIVKTMLNSDIKVFIMKSTSKESAVRKIETCCKAYLTENTNIDLELLSSHNVNDLRRNILNTQFWTKIPKRLEDSKNFDTNNCNTDLSKSIYFNSFIIGDPSFSTDHFRKLLLNHVPYCFVNAISQYQSLGYNVLYSNLFYLLDILDFRKCEKMWPTASCLKSSSNNTKSFSDAQMWEEACEIFKLKKLALQNGSSSHKLTLIANALDNFSFADILRGASTGKFQWISMPERIKMWSSGLPICSDHSMHSHDDILQILSLIHIYILRKILSADYSKSGSCENKRMVLQHPFLNFEQELAYKTEEDLKCLSYALPPSQQLNKVALILDYLSMIKIMCQDEEQRQLNSGKRSGRFLHYFDSISFLLDKTHILST